MSNKDSENHQQTLKKKSPEKCFGDSGASFMKNINDDDCDEVFIEARPRDLLVTKTRERVTAWNVDEKVVSTSRRCNDKTKSYINQQKNHLPLMVKSLNGTNSIIPVKLPNYCQKDGSMIDMRNGNEAWVENEKQSEDQLFLLCTKKRSKRGKSVTVFSYRLLAGSQL